MEHNQNECVAKKNLKASQIIGYFSIFGPPVGLLLLIVGQLLLTFFDHSFSGLNFNASSSPISSVVDNPIMLMMLVVATLFSYVFGIVPALIAGVLFAIWYQVVKNQPQFFYMLVMGLLSGLVSIAIVFALIGLGKDVSGIFLSFKSEKLIIPLFCACSGVICAILLFYKNHQTPLSKD